LEIEANVLLPNHGLLPRVEQTQHAMFLQSARFSASLQSARVRQAPLPLPLMTVVSNTVACGLAVLLLGMALGGRRKLQGTTLTAPCVWIAVSATCLAIFAIVEMQFAAGIGLSALQFAVAVSTLCPLIAVLGAKRPQDRGWQWVVLSLWLIAVWPAAQALANPAGPRVEIFTPWKLFLMALVAMGPLNYLATRYLFASLLVAAGQFVLLGEFLGWSTATQWHLPIAVGSFLFAAILIILQKSADSSNNQPLASHTASWLRFRDSFGAFWGLRIMQRVNETATLRSWPVQLTWSGFERVPPVAGLSEAGDPRSETSATVIAEIEQTLDTLLRRFF
jgi:hypothetical protein